MAFQGDSIFWVEVEKIVPNPFQPRREFDESKLKELAESVQMYGILQPLTVTRNEIQREDGTFYTQYELIAGERRLRASKIAGLSQVPVIIREGEDSEQEKLELAIIENLQREDLNAVDRALAFRQLADTFGMSHTMVAKKVGRSREYVSNSIRLLALPDYMLNSLRQGEMAEGHARTLLMLNDRPEEQDVVFREILLKKLSVRELERIVRKIATDKVRKRHPGDFDSELIEMEKQFTETLGTRVQIQKTDYGGKLTIDYFSVDDLEEMLVKMKKEYADKVEKAGEEAKAMLTEHTPLNIAPEDDTSKDEGSNLGVVESSATGSIDKIADEESRLEPEPEPELKLEPKSEFEPELRPELELEQGQTNTLNQTPVAEEKVGDSINRDEDQKTETEIETTEAVDREFEKPKESVVDGEPIQTQSSPKEERVLIEEPEPTPKLDSPLSRPQIVAHSNYKSPVYIRSVDEVKAPEVSNQLASKEENREVEGDNLENDRSASVSSEIKAEVETKPEKSVTTSSDEKEEKPETGKSPAQIDDSSLYSIRNFGV